MPRVDRCRHGCTYGEALLEIDPSSDGFLRRGVVTCYRPAPDGARPARQVHDDRRLLSWLARTDKARAFELDRTADGGLVLQTWMLEPDPSDKLASISRQLAYLDFQGGRVQHFAGTKTDRNARLYLR